MNFLKSLAIVSLVAIGSNATKFEKKSVTYGPHGAIMCNGCVVTGTGGDLSLWGWENNTACEIDTKKCSGGNGSSGNTVTYGPHGAIMCKGCVITGTGGDLSLWGWENNTACEIDTDKCNNSGNSNNTTNDSNTSNNNNTSSSSNTSSSNNTSSNNNNSSPVYGPHGTIMCKGCEVTGTGDDISLWGWENDAVCEIDADACNIDTSTIQAPSSSNSSSSSSNYVPAKWKKHGRTTRYWDCCKPSCSWPGKGDVSHVVNTCNKRGSILNNIYERNGCEGGEAFMCTDQQPWAVNDNLSYGFAAGHITGLSEKDWCCACYKFTFTNTAIAGKQMIVQITNTGNDLGENHFDIQIPGGGLGIFDGCSTQFNVNAASWGQRYGGLISEDGCNNLPKSLQAGCHWRFNWFKNVDNPEMDFEEVVCPDEIVAKTNCRRI